MNNLSITFRPSLTWWPTAKPTQHLLQNTKFVDLFGLFFWPWMCSHAFNFNHVRFSLQWARFSYQVLQSIAYSQSVRCCGMRETLTALTGMRSLRNHRGNVKPAALPSRPNRIWWIPKTSLLHAFSIPLMYNKRLFPQKIHSSEGQRSLRSLLSVRLIAEAQGVGVCPLVHMHCRASVPLAFQSNQFLDYPTSSDLSWLPSLANHILLILSGCRSV